MKTLATLSAAAFGLALAGAAMAQDVKLSYADLDLSQPADAATFSHRLDAAAASYCAGQPQVNAGAHARCLADARSNFTALLPTSKRDAYQQAMGSTAQASVRATSPAGS